MLIGRSVRHLFLGCALLYLFSPRDLKAQVSFQTTIEFARKQNDTAVPGSRYQSEGSEPCQKSTAGFQGNVAIADFVESVNSDFTLDAAHFPEPTSQTRLLLSPAVSSSTPSDAQLPAKSIPAEEESNERSRCAAIEYLELSGVNAQLQISRRQEQGTRQLLRVATLRVVARIDDPVVLTRAKLLKARATLATVELETAAQQLRKQLAALTGLAEEKIKPIADSVPPVPDIPTDSPDLQAIVEQMAARRDVAQLEYVLARTNRNRTQVKAVGATANQVDLLTAYIAEDEKLRFLVQRNLELQLARLSVLKISRKMEHWISWDKAPDLEQVADAVDRSTFVSYRASPRNRSDVKLGIRSIIITPALSKVVAGRSQQFSLIAVYTDGKAKNLSSEAAWWCSSNFSAVVSTSGLMSAIEPGQVTISATISGGSHSLKVSVMPDDEDRPY